MPKYFQIECGLKCMDTAGSLTLRYKDGVCALGGFHAFNDGPESEVCFLNSILYYGGAVSILFRSARTSSSSSVCLFVCPYETS